MKYDIHINVEVASEQEVVDLVGTFTLPAGARVGYVPIAEMVSGTVDETGAVVTDAPPPDPSRADPPEATHQPTDDS
jgi:hypothetical protein